MATVLENVAGDLFVGEANLFFKHPRYAERSPYRLETAARTESGATSFGVRAFNPNMIVLCDSRMNAARVLDRMCASDMGCDTVSATADNSMRWTNLPGGRGGGRHWAEGEENRQPKQQAKKPKRVEAKEETAASRLIAQLPPKVAEAVRDGRTVVISRTSNLLEHIWGDGEESYDLRAFRLCRSFNNQVYALCRAAKTGTGSDGKVPAVDALLFVGRYWPERNVTERVAASTGPTLTVARNDGGRIFCICLGSYLTDRLEHMSVEEIARCRRHYEGYFGRSECESFLKTRTDGSK